MRLLLIGCIASTLTSCVWTASTPSGIREFYRGQNGLVTTGKAKPNVVDEYHRTQRATDVNSLDRLLSELNGGAADES